MGLFDRFFPSVPAKPVSVSDSPAKQVRSKSPLPNAVPPDPRTGLRRAFLGPEEVRWALADLERAWGGEGLDAVRAAARAAADFYGPLVGNDGKLLLAGAFTAAAAAVKRFQLPSEADPRYAEALRFSVLSAGLAIPSDQAAGVVALAGEIVWNPFAESFADFMLAHPVEAGEIEYVSVSPSHSPGAVRAALVRLVAGPRAVAHASVALRLAVEALADPSPENPVAAALFADLVSAPASFRASGWRALARESFLAVLPSLPTNVFEGGLFFDAGQVVLVRPELVAGPLVSEILRRGGLLPEELLNEDGGLLPAPPFGCLLSLCAAACSPELFERPSGSGWPNFGRRVQVRLLGHPGAPVAMIEFAGEEVLPPAVRPAVPRVWIDAPGVEPGSKMPSFGSPGPRPDYEIRFEPSHPS